MSMLLDNDPRRNSLLNAALVVFSRYGLERGTLADIARRAGLARPLIYLAYPNKIAIFTALAKAMAERTCSDCEDAWPQTETFETGLCKAAIVLSLTTWQLTKNSPHGAELMMHNNSVNGEVSLDGHHDFINLIEARLIHQQQARQVATMIAAAVHGLQDRAANQEELIAHITQFAQVMTAGLGQSVAVRPR